jgi:hypothetical protein
LSHYEFATLNLGVFNMHRVTITIGTLTLKAELNDTLTARKVWDVLPISAKANVWGDEVYFEIPVSAAQEPDARVEVEVGTLAFWPVGNAFCIFFGPTPVSRDTKPRAYSPVNILGQVVGDATMLRGVTSGTQVNITKE